MERTQLWWRACGVMAGIALLSACGGGGGDEGDADGTGAAGGGSGMSADVVPSAGASADPSGGPVSEKAAVAERIKSGLESRLALDEDRFGSGSGSPCSAASAKLFKQECADAAEATNEHAAWALTQTRGREGFATLTSAAQKIQKAAARYQELGCAKNPADPVDRQACLEPGAVLAQGFPDLRDGANRGLAGK
ncbi:hypothetical protein M8Z33_15870 [Streptomyces sp. ZAF1911]|uniref:hypothetical protein n=1 Tax=unclassified Streptomyces TaxID=2593676 RepID=UPI00237A7CD1|nr:hypothetical protein [Streptomyces sp. ZAF1911]MDD9378105.1 hypothetical protein [Streptomyces sp. ZAF1911]